MESILIFFVSLTLIIVSSVTMAMSTVNSTARLSESYKVMQTKTESARRTEIVSLPPQDYSGGTIDLTVKNEGQVNISDFGRWDVIIEEPAGNAAYLTYSASYPPGNNQWAVEGIYVVDDVSEVFDINILNPGEQAVIGIDPGEMLDPGETIKITLSTSDGVTSQCYVTRQASP